MTARATLLCLALATALPGAKSALAQDFLPATDPAQIAACFATAAQGDDACVGEAASQCMNQPGGETTPGTAACLAAEADRWDGHLNAEYKARMAELTPDQKTALREAQRAWIAFRDADCGLQYQIFVDGTIRSVVYSSCMLTMTAERALALRDLGGE